jgi:uncharacterized membrane protein (DUF2068 family)
MHQISKSLPAAKYNLGILLIAIFKLFKASLLIAVGIGALRMLHRDVADQAMEWINALRVDPDNRYIHAGLGKLVAVDDHRLKEIGVGTFIYAALLATEGIGLLMRKKWAEYFTIIMTASFVPIEVYEMIHHFTMAKIIVFALNLMMVAYLVLRLRWEHTQPKPDTR